MRIGNKRSKIDTKGEYLIMNYTGKYKLRLGNAFTMNGKNYFIKNMISYLAICSSNPYKWISKMFRIKDYYSIDIDGFYYRVWLTSNSIVFKRGAKKGLKKAASL